MSAAQAAPFRPGIYTNTLAEDSVVCVTQANFADMQAKFWAQGIKKRGKDCQIIESATPMAGVRTWKARCTGNQGEVRQYKILVSSAAMDETSLLIDTTIADASGTNIDQRNFSGQYKGACEADTPAFPMWAYFDQIDQRARQAVAADLLYCGSLYRGLSTRVKAPRNAQLLQLDAGYTATAAQVLPGEPEFLKSELARAVTRVAKEIVDASPEELISLAQSKICRAYAEDGSVEKAIQQKDAELNR